MYCEAKASLPRVSSAKSLIGSEASASSEDLLFALDLQLLSYGVVINDYDLLQSLTPNH